MLDEVLREFDRVRQHVPSPGARLEHAPPIIREVGGDGDWHTIVYARFADDEADALIEREIEHFTRHAKAAAEFEWKVYSHDQPACLKERLARRGFEIGQEEALLVMDLASLRMELRDPSASLLPGSEVRRVDSPATLTDARAVWESVFEKDFAATASDVERELSTGGNQHAAYVAYHQGRPVSAARATFHDDSPFVGLWTGGTLASHRGQGFYQALVAARAQEAIHRGKKYLTVDARPTSLPILLRRGFVKLSTTWPCVWRK